MTEPPAPQFSTPLSVPMDDRQQLIYEGLQYFSQVAADFYGAGVKLCTDVSVPARSHLIAHCAREIDGCIRDFLSSNVETDVVQKGLSTIDLVSQKRKKAKGHVASILTALNKPVDSSLAEKWIDVAIEFARFVHRSKFYEQPRLPAEIIEIWNNYEDVLYELMGNYHAILERVKRITEYATPTDEILSTLPSVFQKERSFEASFYESVGLSWFPQLLQSNFFDETTAVGPVQHENGGHYMPDWLPLIFLIRLSESIKEGNNQDDIIDLVEIVKKVSQRDLGNYRINYRLIKILSNLPNEAVSDEVLDFIPSWLGNNFDSLSESAEICEKLLPKFLTNTGTAEDALKSEKILRHLFTVVPNRTTEGDQYFLPIVEDHQIRNMVDAGKLTTNIAKLCSINVILDLSDSLKKLLVQYPDSFNRAFKVGEFAYSIQCEIIGVNLEVILSRWDEEQSVPVELMETIVVKRFERLSEQKVFLRLEALIDRHLAGWKEPDSINVAQSVAYILNNDLSKTWCKSISKMEDSYAHGRGQNSFGLLLRDLINHKLKIANRKERLEILSVLVSRCKLPFFKRIALYAINENWKIGKTFFFNMLKKESDVGYFSQHHYKVELRQLLQRHAASFSIKQNECIERILSKGPQPQVYNYDSGYEKHWLLEWYSALKTNLYFEALYSNLSKEMDRTVELKDEEEHVIFGSRENINYDDILERDVDEIANFILDFRPKDQWTEGAIYSLANALSEAIGKDHERFQNGLDEFVPVVYDYAQHIIRGFGLAIQGYKKINLTEVLRFCESYVSRKDFGSASLEPVRGSTMQAKVDWVTSAIFGLITDVAERKHPVKPTELDQMKRLLTKLIPMLERDKEAELAIQETGDVLTYSIHSTVGKGLWAVLDYSVMRLNTNSGTSELNKWEDDAKALFQSALDKKLVDGFVSLGWQIHKLNKLDSEWLHHQMQSNIDLRDRQWVPMMWGYLNARPFNFGAGFDLMSPHYTRALQQEVKFNQLEENGIPRHMALYYLWGRGTTNGEDITGKFIQFGTIKQVGIMCHHIASWANDILQSPKAEEEAYKFRIIELWKAVIERINGLEQDGEIEKAKASLVRLVQFFDEMNDENFDLLTQTCKNISINTCARVLYKTLSTLVKVGNEVENARRIGSFLYSIKPLEYVSSTEKEHISELVDFIYAQGETFLGDQICSKYGPKYSYEFLNDIYRKYHPE